MAYLGPSVVASGTTFAEFQTSGASGHLERLITAQGQTSAPGTAHTWTATGGSSSGGSLASGHYYSVVTETNGFGETTAGPVSTQITVATGNQPEITFQTLKTGNTGRNVYVGLPSGASTGPFYLYASGITTSTYTLATAVPTNSYSVQPPTTNTTGLTYTDANGNGMLKPLELLRGAKDGNLEDSYRYLARVIQGFNEGDPVTFNGAIEKLRHAHAVFAMLSTLCSEMGTLIDANAGTLTTASTPIGGLTGTRTWP